MSNGALDFSIFYSGGLYLVEKGNLEVGKFGRSVYSTDFNLNSEDFPTLSCIAPARNSVCFSKSIFKVFCTGCVHQGKPINSNVPPSKYVNLISVHTGQPVSNINLSKTVSATSVSPSKPICVGNVSLREHFSTLLSIQVNHLLVVMSV